MDTWLDVWQGRVASALHTPGRTPSLHVLHPWWGGCPRGQGCSGGGSGTRGLSRGNVPCSPREQPPQSLCRKPIPVLQTQVSQALKGAAALCQLCPQINPVFTARGGTGVIPAEANGRREEERGEGGDATDREMLASDLWLLIQLKGLIPRDAPVGKAASKRSPAGRYGH